MAFDWKEFVLLAHQLVDSFPSFSDREAVLRTAVSRAYYGAFCYVRDYAQENLRFQPSQTGKDHVLLRQFLQQQGSRWRSIAETLEDLRKWRNLCDYKQAVDNLDFMLKQALSGADQVVAQDG